MKTQNIKLGSHTQDTGPPHDESIYWAIQNVKEDSGFQLTLARMC